jgi:large subunit ribosomal protein L13
MRHCTRAFFVTERWRFVGGSTVFKTYVPENTDPRWVVVDAAGMTLGRLATQIATLIRGKHKPDYTPNLGNGDYVIVINAEKVVLTGNKMQDKLYSRYTGFPGGLKQVPAETAIAKHPERVIEHAVFGMLPKGRLGRALHTHLKVYKGDVHPHAAQKPVKLELAYGKQEVK